MAVAGSTRPAFWLRLEGERLVSLGLHRPVAHVIVSDPEKAIDLLRGGRMVYLDADPEAKNITRVKEAFSDQRRTVATEGQSVSSVEELS